MGPIVETLPDEQQRRVDAHFAARVTAWTRIYEDQNVFAVIHQQRRAVALRWIDELRLPPGARILDVGCGAGLTATALARRGYAVVAIDTVPGMLERTRQTATEVGVGDRVTVAPGDVQQLDFPDGSFDLTLALGVLPWLPSPLGAMAEMARVVGRGGYVLVTADNRWRLAHVLDPEVSRAFAGLGRSTWSWRAIGGPADGDAAPEPAANRCMVRRSAARAPVPGGLGRDGPVASHAPALVFRRYPRGVGATGCWFCAPLPDGADVVIANAFPNDLSLTFALM